MEALKGLYHADKLDEQSFIDNFTIRLKEYNQIIDNLNQQKKKPLQHFLITGKRGMGKSTLLRRVFIEADKAPLNKKIIAVRLGSEQYRLSRLFKLWEQVIEYLGNKEPQLLEQKKEIEKSRQYEENLIHIINDYLTKTEKTLLLLIDNFDQFIEKIPSKDKHALREALMIYPIQIIGNTVFYNEHFIDYDEPFYDFFKPIHLSNLDKEEAEEFIRLRAEGEGIKNFDEIFKKQKGKINALRILSGGVPRTLLILLSIVSKQNTGDAVDYLHEMIEQVTPLYQDRMKSLSSQQQEIMHNLAMHWDRTPVKDLATEMRVPSKSISAQLVQLEKSGYINKVDIPGRNHYYEIDERFFNIWLLMSEAAPYDTKRVIWLTKWLDAFYSQEEIKNFALYCQNGLKGIKPINRFLLVQALSESEKLSDGYKRKLVKETEDDLKEKMPEVKIWADEQNKKLTEKENLLSKKIGQLISNGDLEEALQELDKLEETNAGIALFGKANIYKQKKDLRNAEKYYLMAIEKGSVSAMYNLALLYYNEKKDIATVEKYYLMAIANGHSKAMYNLGILYETEKKDINTAEKYYLMAVENGNANAMFVLGVMNEQKDLNAAEKYYVMAIEGGNIEAMYNLAILYENKRRDLDNAEKYYLMAIENEHSKAMYNLAYLYQNIRKDIVNAEKYYLMAVDKGITEAMVNLGYLYENEKNDFGNAEKYYLMAIQNNQSFAIGNLSILYYRNNDFNKRKDALDLISKGVALEKSKDIINLCVYVNILLWNEKAQKANSLMLDILNSSGNIDENMTPISQTMRQFLVFRQTQLLYKIFKSNEQWIDRYKPVYFALMHEMKEEYPKEFLKMTEELKEPVEKILDFVKWEQQRLGIN